MPHEFMTTAQRKACPPSTPFAGGCPLWRRREPVRVDRRKEDGGDGCNRRNCEARRGERLVPRRGSSIHAEPAPRYATVRTPPAM